MADPAPPAPPPSAARPVVEVLHGDPVSDPYRWLEQADAPDTQAWIEAQNRYADEVVGGLPEVASMADALAGVFAAGTQYAMPASAGGSAFALRRDLAGEVAVLVRLALSAGPERVVYDPSREPRQPAAIDWYAPSPSGRLVAVGTSVDGSEDATLRVVRTDSGEILADRIEHTRFCSLVWRPDESGFYYTRHPAPGTVPAGEEWYRQSVRGHILGDEPERDVVLFGPGRPLMESHRLVLSGDGRYLYLFSGDGWRRVDVRRIDLAAADGSAQPILEGFDATFDGVERGGRLVLRTNAGAPRYRVVEVDPEHPDEPSWREILAPSELVVREIAQAGDRLVVHALRDVSATVFVLDPATGTRTEVALPGHGTVTALVGGPGDGALCLFESFRQAPTLYRIAASDAGLDQIVAGATSPLALDLAIRQVFYPSADGKVRCPMYLVSRADLPPGPRPTVLTGYGGFNLIRSSRYTPEMLPWVAAGGVFAQANMRGGGEYGEDWHREGMEARRQQSFDDFITAGDYLVAQGVTDRDHLGIEGRSLGGLLTGVALTQRPDLARAVVSGVPLLDMLRYHRFLIGARWIVEYGSPDDPGQYPWLRAYSPYHHVREGVAYPAVYLFCAMDDGRVDALHARKMAALLQETARGLPEAGPFVCRTYFHAGHGAGKPVSMLVREHAEVWGFLAWRLGLALS